MPASLPLDRLQRWMQAVVVHPGSVDEAVASPLAVAEAKSAAAVILPSRTLEPAERVAIYQRMYPLRMLDALATDYPVLQHFLGPERFARLANDYVQVYPSRSYTLNRLSDHLPEYLMNARGLKHREFLVDLAQLELAVTEAFDAAETKPLDEARVEAIAPRDWERAVLQTVAALRLTHCRFNSNEYMQSVKNARGVHPRPRRKAAWLAVYRRAHVVYRLELTREAFSLLSELVAGVALGPALLRAMRRRGKAPTHKQLFRWFRDWVAAGLFSSVRLVGPEGLEPSTSRL